MILLRTLRTKVAAEELFSAQILKCYVFDLDQEFDFNIYSP